MSVPVPTSWLACVALALICARGLVDPSVSQSAASGGPFMRVFQLADLTPAANAWGIDATPDGAVLIADCLDARVLLLSRNGALHSVAGTGRSGFGGDAGPASSAQLSCPVAVSANRDGGFLIADDGRVRKVGSNGIISTVAGTGKIDHQGDGGPATKAELNEPQDVAALDDGGFLIAESEAVRRVSPEGIITTVAGGTTVARSRPSEAAATGIQLGDVLAVAAQTDGGFLVADSDNYRVWRVSASGAASVVAGIGPGARGDGGPATKARLSDSLDVAVTPDGGFLIADTGNARVRAVSPKGIITTVVGPGPPNYLISPGQLFGGPARNYTFDTMMGLAVEPGGFLISTGGGNRNPAILSVTSTSSTRLALALQAPRVQPGTTQFSYRVTARATVRLDIVTGGRTVARLDKPALAGRATIALKKRLRPGLYGLRAEAMGVDGQRARTSLGVFVVGDLTMRDARIAAARKARRLEGPPFAVGQCQRFGPTRADCVLQDLNNPGISCDSVESMRLHRSSGLVYVLLYGCRKPNHGGPFDPHARTHRGTNLVT